MKTETSEDIRAALQAILTRAGSKAERAGAEARPRVKEKKAPASPPPIRAVRAPAEGARKVPISIRLDPDLLSALRESGPGWQTRVNGMLRQAVADGRV